MKKKSSIKKIEKRLKQLEKTTKDIAFKREFWYGGLSFLAIIVFGFIFLSRMNILTISPNNQQQQETDLSLKCFRWNLIAHCVNKKTLNKSEAYLFDVTEDVANAYNKTTHICFIQEVNCTESILIKRG